MTTAALSSICYIGVTGTNGKTSCAWWLSRLLQSLGRKTGLVGTLGSGVLENNKAPTLQATGYTTPDAKLLEKILKDFLLQGVTHVVMEVSSHGLEQGRTRAVTFSTALFTNLSRDHLDYHGTMERYGAAKEKLFVQTGLRHAVINLDDTFGADLAKRLRAHQAGLQVITYSLQDKTADIYVQDLCGNESGFEGFMKTPWGEMHFQLPVAGDFNLANLLGVTGVLCAEGFPLSAVISELQRVDAPPGRLEPVVVKGCQVRLFVDFAHTPDALEKVLSTLRKQTSSKLWCVFGCGGDRDQGKRPLMGAVASRLADQCVVTSDNPRSEKPEKIIEQIIAAMDRQFVMIEPDRQRAIEYAVKRAQSGDVILVAGKGHEKYQEANGIKHPFDDVVQARHALQLRATGAVL
jgi:UDP-N-acetylmuramoyl-L-alanyl-D-glutamate--2,6-diaminopimelate ligase